VRLLTAKLETFRARMKRAEAGLGGAYITVDDTGARHAGKNGYTRRSFLQLHDVSHRPSKSRWRFCRGCAAAHRSM